MVGGISMNCFGDLLPHHSNSGSGLLKSIDGPLTVISHALSAG